MAGKSKRSKLVLSDEDRMELEQLSRSRKLPHREAQRAAIILRYYGGENIASIGRRLGMTRLSVSKWVAKALAVGPMAALKDSYHRPREPAIGDDAKAWVVHLACSKPKDLGYAAEVWSRRALARHVREHAAEAGFPALSRAAKATVHRILAEQPLHPEKVKYYLERREPDFEGGMRRVQYVLTPKHGSWLNIVETLFGKMARSFMRHIRVQSLDELKARILKGIEEINAVPVVHRWKNFEALAEDQ